MDVTKQQQVDDALNYIENNLPKLGLWGLVNNAGMAAFGFVEWLPMEPILQKLSNVPPTQNPMFFHYKS